MFSDFDPNTCLSIANGILASKSKSYKIPNFSNIKIDLSNLSILVTNIRSSYTNFDNEKIHSMLISEINKTYRDNEKNKHN